MTKRTYILAAALATLIALAPTLPAHADQNLGYWNDSCRAVWGNSAMTLTFASDGSWAGQACNSVINNSDPSNLYQSYPFNADRPGTVQCAEIFTYGGYWLKEQYPYTQRYTGSAQIAVRDDLSYDAADLSGTACGSVIGAADSYNTEHGYNTSDNPLATIQQCQQMCSGGGGGGGPVAGMIGSLPGTPKAKHPVRKPKSCYTDGKPTKTVPRCKR